VIRESGDHGASDGGEPAAAWPEAFSPHLSPPLTTAPASPDRARSARGDLPESSRAETEPVAHPVRRAVLRGHVALRHLPPRDPE
jgi:hypothetical protein